MHLVGCFVGILQVRLYHGDKNVVQKKKKKLQPVVSTAVSLGIQGFFDVLL
jgi:hypothetical protein